VGPRDLAAAARGSFGALDSAEGGGTIRKFFALVFFAFLEALCVD
jgi:hypothetical protein